MNRLQWFKASLKIFALVLFILPIAIVAIPNTTEFVQDSAPSFYYFAYGSNLSYDFLKERLKNGEWVDNWHKSGELEEPIPVDLGCYVLSDYEFGYSLNAEAFGDTGTAANVSPKKDAVVYGVLYKLSEKHLEELDITEDVPEAYARVAVKVNQVAMASLGNRGKEHHSLPQVEAWVYVGNPKYVTPYASPDPEYVSLLIKGACEHGLPQKYIKEYLDIIREEACHSR